jgi:hypothetical protein
VYINPTVADFKAKFVRDFPYQPGSPTPVDINKYIQDSEIQANLDLTSKLINDELFNDQFFYTQAFLYLSAHYLVEAIKAAGQGVSGVMEFLVSSKAVGSVSIGYSIPESFLKNPYYALLVKDPYGAKYLELILPYLVGVTFAVDGRTTA